jgi:hypothetical protein
MKFNKNLYPPNGYTFTEIDGTEIMSTGWKPLVAAVIAYRVRTKKPTEGTEQQIMDQICARSPSHCHTPTPDAREKAMRMPSLKSRVLRALGTQVQDHKKKPVVYVSKAVAATRAETCRKCPKHTFLKTSCATCSIAMKEFRRAILGRNVPDTSVSVCAVLGCDLPSSVFLDELTVENAELPGHCWRRKTI